MPKLTEKWGIFVIGIVGLVVIIIVALVHSQYPWSGIGNEYTIIVEIMVGIIIAFITFTRTGRDATTIMKLIEKINDYEEKQKQFLDKLQITRTARINYYGTRLLIDFEHIQQYFENVEKLPKEKLEKLTSEFFLQYDILNAITLNFDNQNVEIPGNQFFSVMKENLQVIESDLAPEVSNFVRHSIELTQMCLAPIWNRIVINTEQWNVAKTNVQTAIDRLNSVVERRPSGQDGVILVRKHAFVTF